MSAVEEQRLAALRAFGVLDTDPEAAYDEITELAARLFEVPAAFITFIDRDRAWVKSCFGMQVREAPRELAFCNIAIRTPEVMIVTDARQDPRTQEHPGVAKPGGVAFYAGAPLLTPDGLALGTLCIIDYRPRAFSAAQSAALAVLARQVTAQLELRHKNAELTRLNADLAAERDALRHARTQILLNEQQMKAVVAQTTEAWWELNLETGAQYYSPAGLSMLGYDGERLQSDEHVWERLTAPEELQRLQGVFAEAIGSGRVHFEFESTLRHRDGRQVPVHARAFIYRDVEGRALRIVGTDADLSDKQQVLEELRGEQRLNEQIFTHSPIGIRIFDADGNCIATNAAEARTVGGTVEAMNRQNIHTIASWKASGIYDLALRTLRSGDATAGVFRVHTTFGKDVWVLVNFRLLPEGGTGHLLLMTDDLTEFKRNELERQNIQRQFEQLFVNTMDGVLHTQPDGSILAANPAACALLGRSEEELRSLHRDALFDLEDSRYGTLLRERRRNGHVRGEARMRRPSGDTFEVELTSTIYRMDDGSERSSTMFHDITERRRLTQKAEESLNLLRNMAQRVPGVIYTFRLYPDGRSCFPFSSDGMWEIYECTPAQVREDATPVYRRLHPADYDAVVASITESARTLQPWKFEYRVVLPEQGVRWRHGHAQPERLADGSVLWHGCITDITERKVAEANTHQLAYFDSLTGLPNRQHLLDRIAQSLEHARRTSQYGALLFLDLDNFKRINDARGHSVGDALLVRVSERLKELLRTGDMVARLGGDEFVVLVNELGPHREAASHTAMAVAERVRRVMETPYLIDGWLYSGTGSIGLTLFPHGGSGVDDLLREADTAMYRAKETGRNRIAYFESSMQEQVEERLALEHDLKEALDTEQITVYVQPQVNQQRRQTGGELLLRWHHPKRGNVPPSQFIPIAEESGLILRLGDFVLRRACEAIARIHAAGQQLVLAVNISPRQFRQEDFVEKVQATLRETGAPATGLILEVTEGLLIENWQDVASRMAELARLGVRFSIDDFGTGYSSLAYLKKLPLHEIKIDRSFVQDTPEDPNDTAIVRSILAMAKHFKLQVVAEGVETEAQAAFLAALQCDYLQGYLFARPQPLEPWLAQHLAVPATI